MTQVTKRSGGARRRRVARRGGIRLEQPVAATTPDWPTWRLREQLVAMGFDRGWAHETANRLKALREVYVDGETALSRVCATSEIAREILGVRYRSTLYRYVENGHLAEFVCGRHGATGWITDQLFLRAECEYLRLQWLVKEPSRRGPVPWEPPTEEEVRAWIERQGGYAAVLTLIPIESDESGDDEE